MAGSQTDRLKGLVGNTGIKAPVRAATTANLVLSGEQSVDGVACVTGNRVLVKDQNTGKDNGIYVVDTGVWSRALDFDGTYDVVSGSLIRANSGDINGGGIFTLTTADDITIGTTSLAFSRLSINYIVKDSQVAAAGQTVFNVGATYQVAANGIAVYVNGIRQRLGADFVETTSTRVTFVTGLLVNDEVDFYIGQSIGNLTAAAAALSSVVDAGAFYISTNVEAVLQELPDNINPDNGDASVAFTHGASQRVQCWNTPLTVNRTATLNAANAREGARFTIVRRAGATGNFDLLVASAAGTLATLRAPGEWATFRYDFGTTAWVLVGYGILPSAEILAMSADNGDASANVTIGTSERTQRWGTALTAERSAALQAAPVYKGARFRIERLETATGGFALAVTTAGATLIRLAPGQWADVEHSGTAWIVTGMGDLRPGLSTLVKVADDFIGQEIDGYRWAGLVGTDPATRDATVRADQIGGVVRMTSGADAGATMALNGVQLQGRLNWRADRGCFAWEARVAIDAITNIAFFIGLTNQAAVLQMPINGSGAADGLTNNAADAVGVLFDTTMANQKWWLVGVKAAVGAAAQNSAVAPVAGTFETWRIEIDATGQASFYRNGTLVGVAMASAVTPSTPLTPVIAAFSRGAASRNADIDFIAVQAQR